MNSSSILDFSLFGIRVLDVVDLLVVAYLFYVIYRLLKGTIAFNIFVGVVLFYALGTAVDFLDMKLLRIVLGPFVVSGVLILIIIFQPEVRQFLLLLGNNTLKGRSAFIDKILGVSEQELNKLEVQAVEEISDALIYLAKKKIGALVIIADNKHSPIWANSGTLIDAQLNGRLLISIFSKNSPLHDGAMIIVDGRIYRVEVVLPLSEQKSIPEGLGLRHRAAVGVSESAGSAAFIVSEETGAISYAYKGSLVNEIDKMTLKKYLGQHLHQRN